MPTKVVKPKPREVGWFSGVFLFIQTAGNCKNCELSTRCANKLCGHVVSLCVLCRCLNTKDFMEFTIITIKCSPLSSHIQIRNAVIYRYFFLVLYTSNIVIYLSREKNIHYCAKLQSGENILRTHTPCCPTVTPTFVGE